VYSKVVESTELRADTLIVNRIQSANVPAQFLLLIQKGDVIIEGNLIIADIDLNYESEDPDNNLGLFMP
jgi:hypothetical protein